MNHSPRLPKMLAPYLFVMMLVIQTPKLLGTDLKPQTLATFSRYVELTETRINTELKRPGQFLYVDGLPEVRRRQVLNLLRNGEVFIERLSTPDSSGKEIVPPEGMLHHWLGAVFIPGATLGQTLELVEDYDHHQDIYKPEVVGSKLFSRNGDDFKIFYRLRKKKVITVTLNSIHDVHYFPVDSTHCYSHSYSTRIAEVADADTPQEHEKPIGHDGGFLWRINSYWRFEEKGGGMYIECESISLTRGLPPIIGIFIKRFVTEIPRESLMMTMSSTRSALLGRTQAMGRQ
ncbi:MAG: hypothetical protein ABSA41_19460 [Terriglobia bacterium]